MHKNSKPLMSTQKNHFRAIAVIGMALLLLMSVAYADTDPVSIIENLSDLIFSLTRAVGIIALLFGIVTFAMSISSHDQSQRTSSILTIVGGLLITFAKEILQLIGAI